MKFPDEYFPIDLDMQEDFALKVKEGKQAAKNLNVLFCAACKDVSHVIKKSISFCHSAGSNFKDYDIFLYENNSEDNTADVIRSLNDEKIILESEYLEKASYRRSSVTQQDRCNFIASARNKCVSYINSQPIGKYDYIFVFDTDIEGGWSIDGVINSIYYLENNSDFGVMTSYCVLASAVGGDLEETDPKNWLMFDSFAFRFHEQWEFPSNLASFNYLKIERGSKPVMVASNFNGLAIYRPECFKENKYYVHNYGTDYATDSEHVGFHKNIWKKGLKVLLNPSMITSISNHKYSK